MKFDPEAIIFDFGGVLINVSYEDTIRAFQRIGIKEFDHLYSQAQQSQLFDQFETGQISAQRFVNEVLRFLPPGTSPNTVVAAWNAMIHDVPKEGIDLLLKLKKKNKRLFLLSNTNEIHIPVALRAWQKVSDRSPYDLFDMVYLSHEMHQRKPDPAIFKTVIEEQGLIPERTLFIDDSIQHIKGAEETGLQTYHLQRMSDLYLLFS